MSKLRKVSRLLLIEMKPSGSIRYSYPISGYVFVNEFVLVISLN